MTTESDMTWSNVSSELLNLVWGTNVNESVFRRWSQGIIFSPYESTAIIQMQGGPCSVLTPIQGFILNELLNCKVCGSSWMTPSETELESHLIDALCAPLEFVSSNRRFSLVMKAPSNPVTTEEFEILNSDNTIEKTEKRTLPESDWLHIEETPNAESCIKMELITSFHDFHKELIIVTIKSLAELHKFLKEHLDVFKQTGGVILFLYSLLLTKGLPSVKVEMADPVESLIDNVHGYGCQNLTNLLLSGFAVCNVWDGDKNVDGLTLHGIPNQASIGFLSVLESMKYCEVGWNLKNPRSPIWILGSETHLTVIFSEEKQLVQHDSNLATARKVFKSFDENGSGFILTSKIKDVMSALGMFTDDAYVDYMIQKLDSEGLGIITESGFLNEFYPDAEKFGQALNFVMFHYNGIPNSNFELKVKYNKGMAKLLDFTTEGTAGVSPAPILRCLRTKWPTIEVDWENGYVPSLN